MRSDTDHREQLDDFSEFMKRKLEKLANQKRNEWTCLDVAVLSLVL